MVRSNKWCWFSFFMLYWYCLVDLAPRTDPHTSYFGNGQSPSLAFVVDYESPLIKASYLIRSCYPTFMCSPYVPDVDSLGCIAIIFVWFCSFLAPLVLNWPSYQVLLCTCPGSLAGSVGTKYWWWVGWACSVGSRFAIADTRRNWRAFFPSRNESGLVADVLLDL